MVCQALKDESMSKVVLNNFFSETIFSFNLTDILLSYFSLLKMKLCAKWQQNPK